jgi:hypothetical protein
MMMVTVDDPIGEPVLSKLRGIFGMSDLRYVELGDL